VAARFTRPSGPALCSSRESLRDFAQLAREIVAEAKAIDEAEDELYGEERGDELPEQLRTREGRAEFFSRAREQQARDQEREASRRLLWTSIRGQSRRFSDPRRHRLDL
jgi:hypothetical protein